MINDVLAERIVDKLNTDEVKPVFIDPITLTLILGIIGVIIQFIRLYCQWKQGRTPEEQLKEMCLRPTLGARVLVNRSIRAKTPKHTTRKQRMLIAESIFDTGFECSHEELREFLTQK